MTVRRGTTLLELLVVLVILGVIAGVTAAALGAPAHDVATRDSVGAARARIQEARLQAGRAGHPVPLVLTLEGRLIEVTAMPDGSVLGGEPLGLDRLSGAGTASAAARVR